MKFARIIIFALLFLLVVILYTENIEVFTHRFELALDLKFYKIGPYIMANLMIMVVSFLAGVIFASIWGAFYAMSMRSELKQRQKRIRELQLQQGGVHMPDFGPTTTEPEPEPQEPPKIIK